MSFGKSKFTVARTNYLSVDINQRSNQFDFETPRSHLIKNQIIILVIRFPNPG